MFTPELIADPAADLTQVPGVVIAHSPQSSGIYIGSPGIAILPDGAYLAKQDEFGPKSTEHTSAVTHVYRSEDQGQTWREVARLDGLFWSNVFVHNDVAYIMGTSFHHGLINIRRSDDGGTTWTEPVDPEHGLITPTGQYHTAPMPMLYHNGRIWRAFEDASNGDKWGERYSALVMSAPVDSDLLRSDSWTFSSMVQRNPAWLGGTFRAFLEGNAVLTPQGQIVDILRVDCPTGGKAAVVRISPDGKTASFDSDTGFIDFPGGSKKFTIRYDEQTKRYWSLVNPVPPIYNDLMTTGEKPTRAASIRNTAAIISSADLIHWKINCIVLHHPEVKHHGFQYPDWLFDGDDMIAVIRTAYDDGLEGAHNAHDANFLTFHRFKNFRELTMADSVVDPTTLGLPNR
ncbi:MAG: exo-alpha-sialidase [Phycisphaeraceae bacterium]|nr:exo-alpha-sialidase [Phycisphaeraceae bacterium]